MRLRLDRFFVVVCIGLAFGVSARGQSRGEHSSTPPVATTTPLPSIDGILSRYLEAEGGRAAWTKITSRVSKGTIEVPSMNLSGTVEIDEKAPDRILSIITISGASFRQAFDGTVGWTDDPQNGVREQTGVELAEARRDADFYHPLDVKKLYEKVAVIGAEKVDDQETYVVEATPAQGDPDKIYFDAATGLPARIISHRHGPDGVTDFREDFDDFREVDGIKLPFTIRQKTSDATLTIQINEMHHNVSFGDSQFTKPAAQ